MTANPQQQSRSSTFDGETFISEHLSLLAMNAKMARDFLDVGDIPGFRYSLACLFARAKAVAGVVNDLNAASSEGSRDHGL